ncbi:putative uncharacterized protein DDB_G0287457 [Microplitis mediator]|uniref:putative uncharacterized protein DDB_G0287457 n=1 Tax=Microplitis mediator TaxID=375433 RepID=UPI0025537540|nr:putative uncharacterized protein DDB_G0287457 [Microplitis mediator]
MATIAMDTVVMAMVVMGTVNMATVAMEMVMLPRKNLLEPKPSFFISKNVNHTNYPSQRFITSKLEKISEPINIIKTHNTDLTSNNKEVNLSNKINPLNKTSNSELSSSIIGINNLHPHDDNDTYDYQYDDLDNNTSKTMYNNNNNNNNTYDKFDQVDYENHIDILNDTLANTDHDNNHIFINTSCISTNNIRDKDHEIDDDDDNGYPEAGIMLDVPQLDVNKIRHHGDERYEEKTSINSFGDTSAESDDDLSIEYNFYDNHWRWRPIRNKERGNKKPDMK